MNSISLLCLVACVPIYGLLADHIGQKPILIGTAFGFATLAYPFFWTASYGSPSEFQALQILISVNAAGFFAIAPVIMVKQLPVKIRSTITSFFYALSAAIFGGATPFIALFSTKTLGSMTAPGIYYMLCAILSGLFIHLLFKVKKSSRQKFNKNNYEQNKTI